MPTLARPNSEQDESFDNAEQRDAGDRALAIRTPIVVGSCLVAIAVAVGAYFGLSRNGAPGGHTVRPAFLVAIMVGAATLSFVVAHIARRARSRKRLAVAPGDASLTEVISGRRKNQVESVAQQIGFSYVGKPTRQERRSLSKLAGLRQASSMRRLMRGELAGRAVTCFEHTYFIYAGQATIPVISTVYLAQAPTGWPKVVIAPTNAFQRAFGRLFSRSAPLLDVDAFNRAFSVKTRDMEFAIVLLSRALQEHLLTKTKRVKWVIGDGAIRLIYPGRMKASRIERSLARLEGFLAETPAALDAWNA